MSWTIAVPNVAPISIARQAAPILVKALRDSGTNEVLDMCSGGGGPFETFASLEELNPPVVNAFILTDLYPNLASFKAMSDRHPTPGRLLYAAEPVDATACDYGRKQQTQSNAVCYLRTMCASMHHMSEDVLERILADVVAKQDGFLALEITSRSVASMCILPLGSPLLACIAFLYHGRGQKDLSSWWQRFVLTFIIPVIPVMFLVDGLISCLRTYTKEEFLAIARKADPEGLYIWTAEERFLEGVYIPLTNYMGVPRKRQVIPLSGS